MVTGFTGGECCRLVGSEPCSACFGSKPVKFSGTNLPKLQENAGFKAMWDMRSYAREDD